MQCDQFFGDKQAKPEPGAASINRIRVLIEPLENQRQSFRRNAASRVGDRNVRELRIGFERMGFHRHGSARRSELESVINQIDQHIEYPVGIGIHQRHSNASDQLHADLLFLRQRPHHCDCLLGQFDEGEATGFDAQLSRLSARRLQQVADHGVELVHTF